MLTRLMNDSLAGMNKTHKVREKSKVEDISKTKKKINELDRKCESISTCTRHGEI